MSGDASDRLPSSLMTSHAEAATPRHEALRIEHVTDPAERKQQCQKFYEEVSRRLDQSPFGDGSWFLNYGYVSDGSLECGAVTLPARLLNRNSVKLVVELMGSTPVAGRQVLDVGCGRGGTVATLRRWFGPRQVVGVDLAATAIGFCRRAHSGPGVAFVVGDAEALPFESQRFDVVTNVESSHSYPRLERFYAEVHRVLRPEGMFLLTDVVPATVRSSWIGQLRAQGFSLLETRDVTGNVLRSCEQLSALRAQAFDQSGGDQPGAIETFVGVPGTSFFEHLQRREWTYEIWTLKKSMSGPA